MKDTLRWKAMMSRDPLWDGRFVYAVRSTGVFCRPSCPSRRPRRDQVVYFDRPEAAEAAGFRPCLRCHPRDLKYAPRLQRVLLAVRFIASRTDKPPTLAEVSAHVGTSSCHLQREFKKIMGISPRQYADARRLSRFKRGLRQGDSLLGSMYDAGYGSSSRIYEQAGAQLGMTPATYGRGGEGARIDYTIAGSPLGRLLVAATSRGVCAVKLGDSEVAIESELRSEFPDALVRRQDEVLMGPVRALLDFLEGKEPHVELPLDIRATAFQRMVWQHLRTIPGGRTATYGEIARSLGREKGARAVARACATNPVALIIPCHRVVPAGGGIGGYRWGGKRKQALLDREQDRETPNPSRGSGRKTRGGPGPPRGL